MNCHQFNFIVFIWELLNFSEIVSEKTCALNKLFVCHDGETCKQVNNSTSFGVCDCKNKFKRISPSGGCVKEEEFDHSALSSSETLDSSKATGSAILGGVVTVFLLIVVAIILVFVAKKYRWLHRAREKAQQLMPRQQYPVLISQEDDPPLA